MILLLILLQILILLQTIIIATVEVITLNSKSEQSVCGHNTLKNYFTPWSSGLDDKEKFYLISRNFKNIFSVVGTRVLNLIFAHLPVHQTQSC